MSQLTHFGPVSQLPILSNPIHWRLGNHPGWHRVLDRQEPDRVRARM